LRKVSYISALVMYILVILYLGSYPKIRIIPFRFDPSFLFHFFGFFLLSLFTIDLTKKYWLALLVGLSVSGLTEVLQFLFSSRVPSLLDFSYDVLGIISAILVGQKGRELSLKSIGYFFGVGKIPIAPGTIASFVFTLIIYWALKIKKIYLWQIFLVILPVSIFASQKLEDLKGEDPKSCVIDEVAGMALALTMVKQNLFGFVLSFLFFRFFDIVKPLGIKALEKRLSSGIGIVLDDLMAGLYSALLTKLLVFALLKFGISL